MWVFFERKLVERYFELFSKILHLNDYAELDGIISDIVFLHKYLFACEI